MAAPSVDHTVQPARAMSDYHTLSPESGFEDAGFLDTVGTCTKNLDQMGDSMEGQLGNKGESVDLNRNGVLATFVENSAELSDDVDLGSDSSSGSSSLS